MNENMMVNASDNDETEIDLGEIFSVLMHRLWLILLVTVICGAAGYSVSRFLIPEEFESTTQIYVLNRSDSDRGTVTSSDLQAGTQLTKDYASIITSRYVLENVIRSLNLDYSYEELAAHVDVTTPTDTRIVSITVTDQNPARAQRIADEIRKEASEHIQNVMDIDAVNVVEEANLPAVKSSPNNARNAAIAALIGLLVTVVIIVVRYIMDDTIKTQEDVNKYLGLSTLALIPLDEEIVRNSVEVTDRKRKKKKGKNGGRSSRHGDSGSDGQRSSGQSRYRGRSELRDDGSTGQGHSGGESRYRSRNSEPQDEETQTPAYSRSRTQNERGTGQDHIGGESRNHSRETSQNSRTSQTERSSGQSYRQHAPQGSGAANAGSNTGRMKSKAGSRTSAQTAVSDETGIINIDEL